MRLATRRADEKFKSSTILAARAADVVLQQQRATIGVMLEKLCRYYAAAFESGQQLAHDFTKMADSLSALPCERVPEVAAHGRGCPPLLCCLMPERQGTSVPPTQDSHRKATEVLAGSDAFGGLEQLQEDGKTEL